MFIKGFKNSAFGNEPWVQWALSHKGQIIVLTFVVSTIIFEILKSFFKVNILKIIVLAGTFALAMAFAGNDLVNFIGVPLAGYSSYEYWAHSGVAPDQYTMEALSGKVQVPSYFLIGAGLIMVLTLWFSKKARTVIETSVNLSRQDTGYERFGSSPVSRSLVRAFINFVNLIEKLTPEKVRKWVAKRFEYKKRKPMPNDAAFDLIRASVNLVVASALIALATSYKLPLSTTYVTFMVAMGTSLADRAWGRESAVYRVTGVISVIGGWFFTALVAFTVAFIIAMIIAYGGALAIGFFIAMDIVLIYHSRLIHKRRREKEEEEKRLLQLEAEITPENVFDKAKSTILRELQKAKDVLELTKEGFINSDRRKLKNAVQISESLKDNSKQIKKDIYRVIQALRSDMISAAQYYVQAVDHLREIANAAVYLSRRMQEHIDNNHEIFKDQQLEDFNKVWQIVYDFVLRVIEIIENNRFQEIDRMRKRKNEILKIFEDVKTIEIERIQKEEVDPMNSNLFLNILAEYKNLVLFFNRILKAHKRFYSYKTLLKTEVAPAT
jgi:phosphate/sulfate permease